MRTSMLGKSRLAYLFAYLGNQGCIKLLHFAMFHTPYISIELCLVYVAFYAFLTADELSRYALLIH